MDGIARRIAERNLAEVQRKLEVLEARMRAGQVELIQLQTAEFDLRRQLGEFDDVDWGTLLD